ncbi:MAG: hypothetical protein IJ309_01700 [Clostridia bacterium]|nr:hypothetical protein [Clostridia bacterium]
MICKRCGARISDDSSTCKKCGTRIATALTERYRFNPYDAGVYHERSIVTPAEQQERENSLSAINKQTKSAKTCFILSIIGLVFSPVMAGAILAIISVIRVILLLRTDLDPYISTEDDEDAVSSANGKLTTSIILSAIALTISIFAVCMIFLR